MTTANKLTIARVALIPVFLVILYLDFPHARYAAFAVFAIACMTDFVDGYIARHYNQITNFGKFMDPLADKILVDSALICLVALGRILAWIVVIIIAREFTISGFRLIAAEKNVVIAANMWGKSKTVFQMAMVILMIVDIPALRILTDIVMWIATALTVISLVTYIAGNKDVLKDVD